MTLSLPIETSFLRFWWKMPLSGGNLDGKLDRQSRYLATAVENFRFGLVRAADHEHFSPFQFA